MTFPSQPNPLAFDAAIALIPDDARTSFTATTTPAYHNMIGPYGGITAAVLLQAVLSRTDVIGQPLSLTVHYIKVVAEGEYSISTELIGHTKTTQHFSITARQNGDIILQGLTLFGTLRPRERYSEIPFPQIADPDCFESEDLYMAWSKNFDFRFAQGGIKQVLNCSEDDSSQTRSLMWVRNNPPRPVDFPALAAVSDSFIPRAMLLYKQMVPVGTVSLTVYFHASYDILAEIGDDFLLGEAQGINFGEGWYDHVGHIWSRNGVLLATTSQMVYFKPPEK